MKLTKKDEEALAKVHPELVRLVRRMAEIATVPFAVIGGSRTLAQQKKNVAKGVSKTLHSRHIIGEDGFAKAVDLAPLVGGKVSWDWEKPGPSNDFYDLMRVARKAAIELKIGVEWGGVWDRMLNELSENLEEEVRDYNERHSGGDFNDGPHLQLPWASYP